MRSLLARARDLVAARPQRLDSLAVLIVAVGGLLRFYRSTELSLWLDEGFTLAYARLPWDEVLGLHGAYDGLHPPLYASVVKAVTLVVRELDAGRYLSVVAGTTTIAILYLLVVRLAGRPVALVACLIAAISPLAIWYSQESRPYAVTGLAVSVSYLALVAFHDRPRPRWAVIYGVAVASAVYLDYSALYALAPQLAILPLIVMRHRRGAIPIFAAGVAAVLAFTPWLPNLLGTLAKVGNLRLFYLEAGPAAIQDALLAIVGFGGRGTYFASNLASPWTRWAVLDPLLAILAITAVILGGIALAKRPFSLVVVGALSLGTVLTGVFISQFSPGFAPRTMSYAVLGWAILLGAAAAGEGMSAPRRAAGVAVVGVLIVISAASLQSIYQSDKEHWRDWAKAVADAAKFGFPVVTYPNYIAPTMVDAYEPGALGPHLELLDEPDLDALASFAEAAPALWVASYDIAPGAVIDPFLRRAGFDRILRQSYVFGLSLNLYVRHGVTLGLPIDVNTTSTSAAEAGSRWMLAPGMASAHQGPEGLELTLSTPGGTEAWAALDLPAEPRHLYSLSFDARSRLTAGDMRAFLICLGHNDLLNVAPDDFGAGVPAGVGWQKLSLSVLCPDGTDHVRINLHNAGSGALDIRDIRLFEATPP